MGAGRHATLPVPPAKIALWALAEEFFLFFLHFFHLNFAKIYGPQEKITKLYIWRRGGRR
jgi:hypothetical protein